MNLFGETLAFCKDGVVAVFDFVADVMDYISPLGMTIFSALIICYAVIRMFIYPNLR